ncbi:Serine/threonine-protein kinase PAK 1, partial [Stegodyphus mimosarum]
MNVFTKLRSSKKSSKKEQTPSEIGIPFSVKHNIHVEFNQDTGEIEGLPEPWLRLLQQANISKSEQSQNPTAVLQALKYYVHSIKKKPGEVKFITTAKTADEESQEIEDSIAETDGNVPISETTMVSEFADGILEEKETDDEIDKVTTDLAYLNALEPPQVPAVLRRRPERKKLTD